MILFTGQLNGETVEDKIVSADAMIKEFKLPLSGEFCFFRFVPSRINTRDGGERTAIGFEPTALVSGYLKGNAYQIRYFKTRQPKGVGVWNYQPKNVGIPRLQRVEFDQDKELAVILALSQHCKNSPFAKNDVWYEIVDEQGETRKAIEKIQGERKIAEALVTEKDQDKLRQIAKGIVVSGVRIPSQHTQNGPAAMVSLMELLRTNPAEFEKQYNDPNVLALGFARMLIDDRLVEHRDNTWYSLKNKKIVEGDIDMFEGFVVENYDHVQKLVK